MAMWDTLRNGDISHDMQEKALSLLPDRVIPSRHRKDYLDRVKSRRCMAGLLLYLLFIAFALSRQMPSLVDRYDWRSIPNRVHFVRQVDRDARGQKQDLHFEFKHFMAVYSAHLWTKPEKIYIWTDASEESIKAAKNSSNVYTKAIANLPSVGFHRREMPTITKKGMTSI